VNKNKARKWMKDNVADCEDGTTGEVNCTQLAETCAQENREGDNVILIQQWRTDTDKMIKCAPVSDEENER